MTRLRSLCVVVALVFAPTLVEAQVSYVTGSATSGSSSGTVSPVITKPANTADGDLIVIVISNNSIRAAGSCGNPCQGFTVTSITDYAGAGDGGIHVLTKVASGEGASWTLTNFYATSDTIRYCGVAYRPGTGSIAVNTIQSGSGSGSATYTTPAITPSKDNTLIVAAYAQDPGSTNSGTADASPAATERCDTSAGSGNPWAYIQEYAQTTAASVSLDVLTGEIDSYGAVILSIEDGASSGASLNITTTSPMVTATQGVAYSQSVSATGGTAPYTFSNNGAGTSLNDGDAQCAGLSIASSGAVTGTPTTAGTCDWTAKVTDNVMATDTQALQITVQSAPASPARPSIVAAEGIF